MSELNHHGIQGQKWGKRRYQNPDGTLTAEGRIRYNADGSKRKLDDKHKQDYKMKKHYSRAVASKRTKIMTTIGSLPVSAVALNVAAGSGLVPGAQVFAGGMLGVAAGSSLVSTGIRLATNHKYKKTALASQAADEWAKAGKEAVVR